MEVKKQISLIVILKLAYRFFIPKSIRYSKNIARLKKMVLGHNWIYDAEYYEKCVELPALRSAEVIADTVLFHFKNNSIIDVGCGTGAILEAFANKGCDVAGLEYSDAALKYCWGRGLDVIKFDLEKDRYTANRIFDIAMSTEVAEHLPEKVADSYINLLTQLSGIVIITAAPPGQGGTDHVNEQPRSYWIDKFQKRGYNFEEDLSAFLMQEWERKGIQDWYYLNLMIFKKSE